MNANTRLRLWKEARALLPMWAAIAALISLPFLLRAEQPMSYAIAAYWFGCAVLGPVCIGQEFQHRTTGLLLSQPVSRRRLWWEKMAVLGAAMFGLFVWMELLWGSEVAEMPVFAADEEMLLKSIVLLFLPLLTGFCTGPVLTLAARNTIGGIALTFLCPWALWLAIGLPILYVGFVFDSYSSFARATSLVACLYSGGLLVLGSRRFQRLEDNQGRGAELSLPAALAKPFAEFTGRFTLGHGSALGHLVRKEVRLQLPAFVVASGLVAMWFALVVLLFFRPAGDRGVMMLPTVLLCLGIPVIAGIVSTAEERSLGLLDWHLTLPVSARRQWFVKVLVAFGVNVVLGILLPGVLGQASSWIAEDKQMVAGLPGEGVPHFLIANLVIFCAALYASTASANSMRALIGTIVLFLAGAMVLNFADYIADWHWRGRWMTTGPVHEWPAEPPNVLVWTSRNRWLLGWNCLAVWLYFLGLAGFRRSLESFWLPVRRMAVFFAVVCAFVFAAIIW